MMDRHLIAYAILAAFLIAAVLVWRRIRRGRRAVEPHLRIDLLGDEADEPLRTKP